ncbi:MAG: 4-(cytidine 5'-diphospho)-2-C-methyl-D-erythritol kinase [Endomicrobium sp.]|jgi:4-diphosphocytidyl-2-C-methyl-D-erythritol kinase|nr:4-(cytidine 5'-diphospho)-2-C-methyl-D-erythritol kinase [Endomicrobium sp.]
MKITLKAPAKVNFFLEIKSKRKDKYHNLESIMQTVSLYDDLCFELLEKEILFECNDKSILAVDKNIVCKAIKYIKEYYDIDKGIKVCLKKNIPLMAGLGGGSSDAATTIKALVMLWGIKTTKNELLKIAVKLGADVPFFLNGGTALCRGIGEIITPLKDVGKLNIIIVNPRFSIPTSSVYKKIKWPLLNQKKVSTIEKIIYNGLFNTKEAFKNCFNRLEEFVLPYYPKIVEIKKVLNRFGYITLMSGSGSTIFGISDSIIKIKQLQSELSKYKCKIWFVTTTKACSIKI